MTISSKAKSNQLKAELLEVCHNAVGEYLRSTRGANLFGAYPWVMALGESFVLWVQTTNSGAAFKIEIKEHKEVPRL